MQPTNVRLAQPVLADLRQVLAVVQEVLDTATVQVRTFFENRQAEVDTYLFAHQVRYEVKVLLEQQRYRRAGYRFVVLSQNGLFLIYQSNGLVYEIRIRKADEEGDLPTQNLSRALREFYNQPTPYFPGFSPAEVAALVSPRRLKLIVVWDVDETYTLGDIFLVCPMSESGDIYFADRIPPAATAISASSDFDDEPEELYEIDVEPFERTGTEGDDDNNDDNDDGDTE